MTNGYEKYIGYGNTAVVGRDPAHRGPDPGADRQIVGRGIGHRLVAGRHDVTVVDRDPEEAEQLVEELRGAAEGGATLEAAGPGAELRGEVVILAVYYPGNLEIARELGDRLAGKVVVDISNPLNQTYDGLATPPGTSAAEEVAQSASAGARVVKAFNTTFSGTLVEGQVASEPLDVLIAGDDPGGEGDGGAARARRELEGYRRWPIGAC